MGIPENSSRRGPGARAGRRRERDPAALNYTRTTLSIVDFRSKRNISPRQKHRTQTYVRSNLIQGLQKLRVIPRRLMLARAALLLVLPKIPKVQVRKAGAIGV